MRCIALLIALTATLTAADFTLAADPPGNPASTPLPPDKPWVPGWCRWDWRETWLGQHRDFVDHTKKNAQDITAVFYGDSLTQGWGSEAAQVFADHFGKRGAVNYGIGGDSTRQLLWRISHGEVDGLSPAVVVLCVGTNNLYDDANGGSDEEIIQGITTVVHLLQHKLPRTRILLLGLLPRQNAWFCGRISRINAGISKLDDGGAVTYLDAGNRFISAPGVVIPELFHHDQLHLGQKGYAAWAAAIRPRFDGLMPR